MKDNTELIEKLKPYIKDYLEREKGLDTNKAFKCLNPSHSDSSPSMSFNKEANNVHCFSCSKTYDLLDLIGIDYNTDNFNKKIEIACDLFNIENTSKSKSTSNTAKPLPVKKSNNNATRSPMKAPSKSSNDLSNKIISYANNIDKTDYFKARGISETVIKEYMLGYQENYKDMVSKEVWNVVTIPISKHMINIRNVDKAATKKNRYRKEGKGYFFGYKKIRESGQVIFITEGEIDSLSIISLGLNSIATGGISGVNNLLYEIEAQKTNNIYVILYDNDERGIEGAKKLEEGLEKAKQEVYNINICKGTDYKDVNDYLVGNKPKLWEMLLDIEENPLGYYTELKRVEDLKEYEKNNASNYIDNFLNGIEESINTPFIPTGFSNLDNLLDGGLYEGLYFIGAISSLGKTTLTLQIADNIAAMGKDVLIISLEMARSELMAKSISRLTFTNAYNKKLDIKKYAKDLRGITTGSRYLNYNKEEIELINISTKQYREMAKHLYIYEGVGNIGTNEIKDIVSKHKALKGQAPVVIIDYVQILAPHDLRATDKQNTDKAVLELKRIARDFKATILGISSFNRDSYSKGVSLSSFKESGRIKSCHAI